MINLLGLVSAPREDAERILIAHFTEVCRLCRAARPTSYALLCAEHAPLVRAVVDLWYFAHLCEEVLYLTQRLTLIDRAIGEEASDPLLLAGRFTTTMQLSHAQERLNRIQDASTDIIAALEKAAASQRSEDSTGNAPSQGGAETASA